MQVIKNSKKMAQNELLSQISEIAQDLGKEKSFSFLQHSLPSIIGKAHRELSVEDFKALFEISKTLDPQDKIIFYENIPGVFYEKLKDFSPENWNQLQKIVEKLKTKHTLDRQDILEIYRRIKGKLKTSEITEIEGFLNGDFVSKIVESILEEQN